MDASNEMEDMKPMGREVALIMQYWNNNTRKWKNKKRSP